MSLDDQVLATQKVCNIYPHNLRRIGSKLPHALKVQLVHSCIFSVLDYCNCTYGALSCSNLQKLQKIQYDATRFIFNIKGKQKWEPITLYLKRLHFLPVKGGGGGGGGGLHQDFLEIDFLVVSDREE